MSTFSRRFSSRGVLLLAFVLAPAAWCADAAKPATATTAAVAAHPPGAAIASGHALATDAGLQ
ncbi:gamma-glutamyltransferase, partial [Xanthomonas perforans]|nr:gamma-glutamyltransferase [Xanthomonas perforans]